MNLLAPRSRGIEVGGRRFVCRPPTLATVALAMEVFSVEFWALARAYYHEGRTEVADALGIIGLLCGERMAAVLETCVSGQIPSDRDGQRALCEVVLAMTDVRALIASLNLSEATRSESIEDVARTEDDGSGLSVFDEVAIALGQRLGCSPRDVYDWPYDGYLATARHLMEQAKGESKTEEPGSTEWTVPLASIMRERPEA